MLLRRKIEGRGIDVEADTQMGTWSETEQVRDERVEFGKATLHLVETKARSRLLES